MQFTVGAKCVNSPVVLVAEYFVMMILIIGVGAKINSGHEFRGLLHALASPFLHKQGVERRVFIRKIIHLVFVGDIVAEDGVKGEPAAGNHDFRKGILGVLPQSGNEELLIGLEGAVDVQQKLLGGIMSVKALQKDAVNGLAVNALQHVTEVSKVVIKSLAGNAGVFAQFRNVQTDALTLAHKLHKTVLNLLSRFGNTRFVHEILSFFVKSAGPIICERSRCFKRGAFPGGRKRGMVAGCEYSFKL